MSSTGKGMHTWDRPAEETKATRRGGGMPRSSKGGAAFYLEHRPQAQTLPLPTEGIQGELLLGGAAKLRARLTGFPPAEQAILLYSHTGVGLLLGEITS